MRPEIGKNPPNGGFFPRVSDARGFTLVELIVIMILIGILASVSLPKLTNTGFDERAFRDRVLSGLRYAQKSAIAARRTVCATFSSSPTSVSFRMASNFGANDCSVGSTLPGTDGQPLVITAANGISFSAVPTSIIFDAAGRPSAAVLLGVNGLSAAQSITIEAETGYVH